MDKQLRILALNAGLENLVDNHPELVEAAWKRRRIYAARLEPLAMTDEPALVYQAIRETESS